MSKDTEFDKFVEENLNKVVVMRQFIVLFGRTLPGSSRLYIDNNFIKDDIRKIVKIKKSFFGNSYQFTLKRLNVLDLPKVVTIKVKSFDALKKIFNNFNNAQLKINDYNRFISVDVVSDLNSFDFGEYESLKYIDDNPSRFVFATAKNLADFKSAEKAIMQIVAKKLGNTVEELYNFWLGNPMKEMFNEWKFKYHNERLVRYVMKYERGE